MNYQSKKISGGLIIAGAALGVLFALIGIVAIWTGEPGVTAHVFEGMDILDETLKTSADGLVLVNTSLAASENSIQVIHSTAKDLSRSAQITAPLVDQIGLTIGQNMSNVIRNTQSSLGAAQTSAKLVDDTLGIISAIPLIGKRYAPAQSLGDSIGSISDSLKDLPESFHQIQVGLQSTAENLLTIQKEMDLIQKNIDTAEQSIADAQKIVAEYQIEVRKLEQQVQEFRAEMPGWIMNIKWILTIIFLWMLIEQVGLLIQGFESLRNSIQVSK